MTHPVETESEAELNNVPFEQLEVGMIVVMSEAGKDFPGLAGRIFKVVAIDDPYVAIDTARGIGATRHMIIGRDAVFVKPSDEMIAAMLPDESWPSVIS